MRKSNLRIRILRRTLQVLVLERNLRANLRVDLRISLSINLRIRIYLRDKEDELMSSTLKIFCI
jgi:hypothetical protein